MNYHCDFCKALVFVKAKWEQIVESFNCHITKPPEGIQWP